MKLRLDINGTNVLVPAENLPHLEALLRGSQYLTYKSVTNNGKTDYMHIIDTGVANSPNVSVRIVTAEEYDRIVFLTEQAIK